MSLAAKEARIYKGIQINADEPKRSFAWTHKLDVDIVFPKRRDHCSRVITTRA
jgi:hypothetical protein